MHRPVIGEFGMKNEGRKPGKWIKPELRRLGKIQDVAGSQGAGAQAGGLKT
jgi:hypothetical protein